MKKIVYSLILFCLMFIPATIYAAEGTVNLSCTPSSVFAGEAVSCTIAGGDVSTLAKGSSFVAKVDLSENLEIASVTANDTAWTANTGNDATNGIFDLKSKTDLSTSFDMATFTVKVKEGSTSNGTITLTTTTFGDIKNIEPATQTITMKTTTDTTSNNEQEDTQADVKNPDTGSNIPFAIIGVGTILVIAGYQIAVRGKKIHKI